MLFRINAIISYKKGGWSTYAATLDKNGHKKYAGGGGPTKEDLREERELFSWPRFIETFPDIALPTAINVSHISDIKFSVGINGDSTFLVTESTGVVDDANTKLNLVKFAYYTRQVYDPAKVTNTAGSSSVNPNAAYNSTYGNFAGYIEAGPDAPAGVAAYANLESITFDGIDETLKTTGTWPGLEATGSGYSVSFWMKLSSTLPPVNNDRLIQTHDGGASYFAVRFEVGVYNGLYIGEGNSVNSRPGSNLGTDWLKDDDLWHHYAFCSLGTGATDSVSFYLDAGTPALFDGKALSLTPNPVTLNLAVDTTAATPRFAPVQFDEISIWSTKLPATGAISVASLYNSGNGPTDLTGLANLTHWWRFESALGDSSTFVSDQVGDWDLDDADGSSPVLTTDVP